MKLPRWLVIGLLASSVLAPLAFGWWWVTWPERTGRKFVALVAERRFGEAKAMLGLSSDRYRWFEFVELNPAEWSESKLKAESRTLNDLFNGRQEFSICGVSHGISVTRGEVTEHLYPWVLLGWTPDRRNHNHALPSVALFRLNTEDAGPREQEGF